MDHSAFDSYALLVEAGGKRLFYTGDLRAHGRKGQLFQRLIDNPPPALDFVLSEATNVREAEAPSGPVWTEEELAQRFTAGFKDTTGLACRNFHPQNASMRRVCPGGRVPEVCQSLDSEPTQGIRHEKLA